MGVYVYLYKHIIHIYIYIYTSNKTCENWYGPQKLEGVLKMMFLFNGGDVQIPWYLSGLRKSTEFVLFGDRILWVGFNCANIQSLMRQSA